MADKDDEQQQQPVQDIDDGLERDLRAILEQDDDTPPADEGDDNDKHEPENKDEQDQTTEGDEEPSDDTPSDDTPSDDTPSADEEPTFDLNGEKVRLSQIQEWRRNQMFQSDYTRKTQELSQERQRMEQAMQALQPYQQLDQLTRTNPQFARAFQQAFQQAIRQAPPAYMPQGMPFGQPMQPQLPPDYQQTKQEVENLKLERDLAVLRGKADADRKEFGLKPVTDAEWQQMQDRVVQTAMDSRISDLYMAYRASGLHADWAKESVAARQQQTQQQTQKQQQAAQAASRGLGGSPRGSKAPAPKTPKDFNEAARMASNDPDIWNIFVSGS